MREIEFKGKRVDNGEWVYGSYIYAFDMVHEHCIRCGSTYAVIPETVGQYTGLKDKNGTKIFEGDLVRLFSGYYKDFANGSAEISFSHAYAGGWVIRDRYNESNSITLGMYNSVCEVIGNIHDKEE